MLCTDFLCYFYRLFETVVGYVSSSSYAVDYEMVKSLELGIFLFRNMVHVRAICDIPEAIAQYREFEMTSTYRCYLHSFYSERILVNYVDIPFGRSGVFYFLKCIGILFTE